MTDQHTCEPTWWPVNIGQSWACPDCGTNYHVAQARHMGGVADKAIRLGILNPDQLGWQAVTNG